MLLLHKGLCVRLHSHRQVSKAVNTHRRVVSWWESATLIVGGICRALQCSRSPGPTGDCPQELSAAACLSSWALFPSSGLQHLLLGHPATRPERQTVLVRRNQHAPPERDEELRWTENARRRGSGEVKHVAEDREREGEIGGETAAAAQAEQQRVTRRSRATCPRPRQSPRPRPSGKTTP